jgi:UDP-2,3-diacylglucosamine pyrophosphatase LpxH
MIIETSLERMLIISDLHVGNPFSHASRTLLEFLDYARTERFDLCINGDGFEILQASFASLALDSVEVMRRLVAHLGAGLRVFYIVGNHDILLEKFLSTFTRGTTGIAGQIEITPFLNVLVGDTRIRIEHGHLYDPSFVKHPALYERLTRMVGPLLHLYPDVYRVWSWYEDLKQRLSSGLRADRIEQSVYYEAADMLLQRGFDIVVFGHTHKPEDVCLSPGRRYINAGNWVRGGSYVRIEAGQIDLLSWPDRTLQLTT